MIKLRNRLAIALLAPAILIALCLLADAFDWWDQITLGNSTSTEFSDLQQVTASAQCLTEDSSRNLYERTCDPGGRPYNYPLIWAQVLSRLGVDVSATRGLGIVIILVFGVSIASISYRVLPKEINWSTFTAFVFSVLAPPTFLLLERGNIDALVFSILVIAAFSVLSHHPISASVGFGIATWLKIFPLPSVLALGRLPYGRRTAAITFVVVLGFGVIALLPSLEFVVSGTPQPLEGGFGAPHFFMVIWNLLEFPGASYGPRIFGVLSFASLSLLYLMIVRRCKVQPHCSVFRAMPQQINGHNDAATLIVIGLGSFLGAYIVGTNFDYRLVFLILLNLGIAALGSKCHRYLLGLSWLLVGLMWCTYAAPIRLQQVADVIWFFLVPALLVLFVAVSRLGVAKKLSTDDNNPRKE